MLPHAAAALWVWRKQRGRPQSLNEVPPALRSIAVGTQAELAVDGVFPRSQCFVQADLILTTHYLLLTGGSTYYVPRTTHYVPRNPCRRIYLLLSMYYVYYVAHTTYYLLLLLTTWRILLTTTYSYYLLLTTYYVAHTTYYDPRATYCLLRTACSLQMDLPALMLRWSLLRSHSVSLLAIAEVSADARTSGISAPTSGGSASGLVGVSGHPSTRPIALVRQLTQRLGSARVTLRVRFMDDAGALRTLTLKMVPEAAAEWRSGLAELRALASPPPAGLSHWSWILSCMRAVGERGGHGLVARSDFRSLLNR